MKKIAILSVSVFVLLLPINLFADDPKPVSYYVMAAQAAQFRQRTEIKVCELDATGKIMHCGFFQPASTQPKFPWQQIDAIRLYRIKDTTVAYLTDKASKNIYRCTVDVRAETLSDCDQQLVPKNSMTLKEWQWIPQQITFFDANYPGSWDFIHKNFFSKFISYAYVTTAALGCQASTDSKAPCPTYVFMLDEKHPGDLALLDGTSIFRWGVTKDANNNQIPVRGPLYHGDRDSIPAIANQEYVPNDPQLVKWHNSEKNTDQAYLYFVNQIDRNVWRCKVNDSTGLWEACESVSSGVPGLPHFTDPMQLRFSEDPVRKAYLTTKDPTNNTTQCDMTADGELSVCRPFVFNPADFNYPHDLAFSGALSFFAASSDIYQCAVNNQNGVQTLDNCHATGFTATPTPQGILPSDGGWSVMALGTIP